MKIHLPCRLCFLILFLLFSFSAYAAKEETAKDLFEMSLEELMETKIYSVSKKEEKLFDAPSAAYVITQEDIRRLGFTSIPEALRIVPGVQVARINTNNWAISIRGFNSQFSNKLLVLMDGRVLYNPLFAGVYWDVQDTLIEDIDRIEVIRGPGGTLWGSNAVNGVINIITKNSKQTQGVLLTGGGGNEEQGFGSARYGGTLANGLTYRLYGKYFNRDDFRALGGGQANDSWDSFRGGFRTDWDVTNKDSITFQGDLYEGDIDATTTTLTSFAPPFLSTRNTETNVQGLNLLARWKHILSEVSEIICQVYYDRTERETVDFNTTSDTADIEIQHNFLFLDRHSISWGGGYRYAEDESGSSTFAAFDPDQRGLHLATAFIQDEIELLEKELYLTLGSKFEHNDFTGFEVQPSGKLTWLPNDRYTLWGSVSRAVRTPSRVEHDIRVNLGGISAPTGPPVILSFFGDENFDSEEVISYETGARAKINETVLVDVTAFYNDYDRLLSIESGTPFLELTPAPLHLVTPFLIDNQLRAETYGVEALVNWQATGRLYLTAAYTFIELDFEDKSPEAGLPIPNGTINTPQNQFHFHTFLNLPQNWEFDTGFYYVDSLETDQIPSYIRVDFRLGWQPTDELELSFVMRNSFDSNHLEFGPSFQGIAQSEVERSYFGKLTWRF